MITFIHLGALGRLGNQMFQYAALRGLGLARGYETKIPNIGERTWHGQKCLLQNFNIEVEYVEEEELKDLKGRYMEPDYMKFDQNFYSLPDNIDLYGFFQSTYYFNHVEDQIRKELSPKDSFLDQGKERIAQIKDEYPEHEIVSLHLRRGDNTNGSNLSTELNEMYGKSRDLEMDSFYGKYLSGAKECFANRKVKYLVFSGGSRSAGNSNETDMEWCHRNFVGDEYLFADENDSMTDFSMIMSCDHNIISHISSFGWWAAYLNPSEEKIVVAPHNYHPDRPELGHRNGFYPETWRLA